jgi:hypothetical protein
VDRTECVNSLWEWSVYVAQNFFLNTSILLHLCFLIFLFDFDFGWFLLGFRFAGLLSWDFCAGFVHFVRVLVFFGFYFFSSLPLMAPSFHFSSSIWQYDISFTFVDQWLLGFWNFKFLEWSNYLAIIYFLSRSTFRLDFYLSLFQTFSFLQCTSIGLSYRPTNLPANFKSLFNLRFIF